LAPTRTGFSSLQRLHNSTEFGRVFGDSVRSTDQFFTVLGRPNTRSIARLGLTISRRAAKRAVDRNKLKRLAREAFRMQQELPTWDFVVMAKPGAAAADPRTLRQSLDQHFQRLATKATAGRNG
jgi:ribonuclease P protein component